MNRHDVSPMNENTVWHYYFDNGSGEFLCEGWATNIEGAFANGAAPTVLTEPIDLFGIREECICHRCVDSAEVLLALGALVFV